MSTDVRDWLEAIVPASQQEQQYRAIFNLTSDAIFIFDDVGRVVEVNPSACSMHGYSREEFIGMRVTQFIHPDDHRKFADFVRDATADERFYAEGSHVRKDGGIIPVKVTGTALVFAGKPAMLAVVRDITEEKRALDALREREQHLHAVVQNTPECVKVVAADGTLLQMNPAGLAMVEADSAETVTGKSVYTLIAPEHRDAFRAFNARICRGESGVLQFDIIGLRGTRLHLETHAVPFRNPDGTIAQLALTRDITGRRRAEETLRESEARFRGAFHQTAIGMAQMDLSGRHILVNDCYCRITGYSREELLAKTFLDITHPDDVEQDGDKFLRLLAGEVQSYEVEKRYIHKDGRVVGANVAVSFVQDEGGTACLIGVVQDISGRKRKEQALQFLVDLNATTQALDEAGEIMSVTARMLGEYLGVDRCAYAEVEREYYTIIGDYTREAPSSVGRFSVHTFGDEALRYMYENRSFVAEDVETDPRIDGKGLPGFRQKGIRAAVCVPLHKAGRLVAGVAVHQKTPRIWLPEEIELVELVAGRCWESIERARTLRILRENEQRLTAEVAAMTRLHELVARLLVCLDLRTALGEVLDAAIALMGADMGNIQLLNPQKNALEIVVHRGFGQDFLDHFNEVSTDVNVGTACGRVMRSSQRVIIEDVHADPEFAPHLPIAQSAGGFRAVQSTPLIGRNGELFGVLSTHYRDPHLPEEHNLRILDLYARQAADFIERMRAEEAMRDTERRQRFIMDSMPQKIFTARPNGEVDYFNRQWMEFCGLSFEQIRDWGWTQFVHPDDVEENVSLWRHAVSTGRPFQAEHRFRRADGEYRWHMSRALPMRDDEGRIVMWIGSNTDVHDLKEAEEATLRRSELVRRLAEVATRINAAHDVTSVVRMVTEEARNLIGSHQSITSFAADENWAGAINVVSLSDKYGHWRNYDAKPEGAGIYRLVRSTNKPMRMTQIELEAHPAWKGFGAEAGKHPPLRGWLAAPLVGRDGRNIGLIQLSDKYQGEFTEDDEAVLVQMAQMASVAIENARLVEDLRDASRRKDEFLATLAHELRNPLAPLRNMLEVVKRTDGKPERVQQAHAMMDRQLVHMVRLIDDLLDVSRVSRGKLELRRERIELATVVSQAVEACKGLIDRAGHKLHIALPPEPVWLYADPVRLTQIFDNLINNACKYSEAGGRIELSAECRDGEVTVRVKDTGIGIPPEKLGSIFEMFAQVDHSLERMQGGLGIGLTLVKQLVEMHDGSVTAHSDGLGRGSEFVVRLPLLNEPQTDESPAEDRATRARSRRCILVVDDNRDSAESLAMLLDLSGNETRVAYDGLQAVEAAERFRPDLVLLDIGLPKLNGYEVCQRIRREPWGKDMTIVAVSGWGQEQDRLRSQEAGFDHHVVKPVDLAVLTELLFK